MVSFVTDFVISWFWLLSPMLVPSVLILAIWRSLSYRGDFALTGSEKLLRVMILLGIFFLLALFIGYFVSKMGHRVPIGWDEVTL
jgi:hypothetical protein